MKSFASALCLLLLACSDRSGTGGNDNVLLNENETTVALSPGTQPVRIGEGGPAFQACNSLGRVVNLPSDEAYLPVRAAPFAEADELMRLDAGAQLRVCTRSIDQRWMGVVVAPKEAPDTDCGVAAPVASPRAYTGPCKSGWVSSAFIRLIAG